MASSFPGAIDSFTDPLSGSPLNSPSHSAQHADLNDAVEKIETKLGIGNTVIGGAGTSFTPTWTNYTRGNGTTIAKYVQVNKLVYVYIEETLGSTSSVTGDLTLTLPLTAASALSVNGQVLLRKVGVQQNVGGFSANSTTTVFVRTYSVSGTQVQLGTISATVPFTWGSNDRIVCVFAFEAA